MPQEAKDLYAKPSIVLIDINLDEKILITRFLNKLKFNVIQLTMAEYKIFKEFSSPTLRKVRISPLVSACG